MSRRITLSDPPQSLRDRVEELGERLAEENPSSGAGDAELLLHVELGFALMERLRLEDEPVTAVWAVLSGTPLCHPRLDCLDAAERRAIANARQIVPYSSRFAWRSALLRYAQLPRHWRHYHFPIGDLEEQVIGAVKDAQPRHPQHEALYQRCLSDVLPPHERRGAPPVEADTVYQFSAKTPGRPPVSVAVQFSREQLDAVPPAADSVPAPRCRPSSFTVRFPELKRLAVHLDAREEELARRYGESVRLGRWTDRLSKLHYRAVTSRCDGTVALASEEAREFELRGFTHVAGMVASGKSTLAILLAALIASKHTERPCYRVTLVVGDTQSAIRLANQINWWFRDDPEADPPIAVPLLGRRTRDKHLRELHASRDYDQHRRRGQPHWGERWLGTACAVQGLIPSDALVRHLNGKVVIPGQEPCQSLREMSPLEQERAGRRSKGVLHTCPFLGGCPAQQMWRDLPLAPVWITTLGAMALGELPRQVERRPIHFGEMIYEQSDIVIFDEADTAVEWFDRVFAEEVSLTNTNGRDGVFDRLGVRTEVSSLENRTPEAGTQRWTSAERGTQSAITATLALLGGDGFLARWVARGYFTPNTLQYRLARRIAGLEEQDPPGTTDEEARAGEQSTRAVLQHFDALFDREADPLRPRFLGEDEPASYLSRLMAQINAVGDSATDQRIRQDCRDWIIRTFPDSEQQLKAKRRARDARFTAQLGAAHTRREKNRLRKRYDQREAYDPVDTLETLAIRLQFALTVALLDRHTRIVFYEWHSRPPSIGEEEQPHRRMPSALLDVLPLPATGRQFGTYYRRSGGKDDDERAGRSGANSLSLFAYTNIGRCYVLNFHRLFTDLDGRPGPYVLALSGTSYLPDSTRFHISRPHGILLPEPEAKSSIADSRFVFLPQYESDGTAIRLSGRLQFEEVQLIRQMARALVRREGGPLLRELEELQRLGEMDPERWNDRERVLLLVNSYRQARLAAEEMRRLCSSTLRDRIYHLARIPAADTDGYEEVLLGGPRLASGDDGSDETEGELRRSDIETFARTGGKILIAPMNAIGRGYNILNSEDKAAFGAVYFLTRPYPHPEDTPALAQEVNRRTLDWAEDRDFAAWREGDGILGRAEALRHLAARYWRVAEQRTYYSTLRPDQELRSSPRWDLAATTAGLIIQAVGRLLRGGVPFHAYFVDAAWAPNNAKPNAGEPEGAPYDTPRTSLLAAVIEILREYATDPIGKVLHEPLADVLACLEDEGFRWQPDPKETYGWGNR